MTGAIELPEYEDITEMIREKRNREGLTQEELAEKTDVSRSWIHKVEKGHGKAGYDTVQKICRALWEMDTVAEKLMSDITAAKTDDTRRTTVNIMLTNDFSQVPVKDEEGEYVGMLTRDELIEETNNDIQIGEIEYGDFESVNYTAKKKVIRKKLRENPAILVEKDGEYTGIITKSDLMRSMSM